MLGNYKLGGFVQYVESTPASYFSSMTSVPMFGLLLRAEEMRKLKLQGVCVDISHFSLFFYIIATPH